MMNIYPKKNISKYQGHSYPKPIASPINGFNKTSERDKIIGRRIKGPNRKGILNIVLSNLASFPSG